MQKRVARWLTGANLHRSFSSEGRPANLPSDRVGSALVQRLPRRLTLPVTASRKLCRGDDRYRLADSGRSPPAGYGRFPTLGRGISRCYRG